VVTKEIVTMVGLAPEPLKYFQPNLCYGRAMNWLGFEGHGFKSQGHWRRFPNMHFWIYLHMLLVVLQLLAKRSKTKVMTRYNTVKRWRHPQWLPSSFTEL